MSEERYAEKKELMAKPKNPRFAEKLFSSAEDRLHTVSKWGIEKSTAFIIFENAYESLREATDAILIKNGYKSYSHIASIDYLKKFKNITDSEVAKLDHMRWIRNGSKYYAKPISIEEAKDAVDFAELMLIKLKLLLEKQLGDK